VLAGTDIVIGLAGKATFVTVTKLFTGAGFHVIL
jgi:hypothetical protein